MQHPDVIARIDRESGYLCEYPVLLERLRPVRIDGELRAARGALRRRRAGSGLRATKCDQRADDRREHEKNLLHVDSSCRSGERCYAAMVVAGAQRGNGAQQSHTSLFPLTTSGADPRRDGRAVATEALNVGAVVPTRSPAVAGVRTRVTGALVRFRLSNPLEA